MSDPTEVTANHILRQLSGVRAGTLPMRLARRLAKIQLAHTCSKRSLTRAGEGACRECGKRWPCVSYNATFGDMAEDCDDE